MQATRFVTLAALGLALGSTPAEARSRHGRGPDLGAVEVINRAGVPLMVAVEDGGVRRLDPFETGRFVVPEGATDIRATYEQYGQTFTLFARTVRVHERSTTRVDALPEESALVRLVNASGVEADFVLDGREIAELRAGETRLVRVPLGSADLRAEARGLTLEAERVFLRPFQETTLVAEAPMFSSLVVDNPLPIAVEVEVGRSERVVEPYGRAVFEHVPVGTVEVETRRLGGELLGEACVRVSAWTAARLVVEPPATGLVRLQSEDDDALRVYANGRVVATLAPMGVALVSLPVGGVALEMRTLDGRRVEDEYLVVSAFRTETVDFGRDERHRSAHRGSHHDRHDHEHDIARR